MAIIVWGGFEVSISEAGGSLNTAVSATVNKYGAQSANCTSTTTGTSYVTITSNGSNGRTGQEFDLSTAYIRFYFRIATAPATNLEQIAFAQNSTTTQKCYIALDSARRLQLRNSLGSLVETGTTVLATDTWYRIEWMVKNGTSADYEVRIDGATELSGTTNQGATNFDTLRLGKYTSLANQAVSYLFDDYAIDDSTWPGEGYACTAERPTADGAIQQWTDGTGASDYTQVNATDTTTYCQNPASTNQIATFKTQSATAQWLGHKILSRAVVPYCREVPDTATQFRQRIYSGSSYAENASSYDGTAGRQFTWLRQDTDPATGAEWTTAGAWAADYGCIEETTGNRELNYILIYAHIGNGLSLVETTSITEDVTVVISAADTSPAPSVSDEVTVVDDATVFVWQEILQVSRADTLSISDVVTVAIADALALSQHDALTLAELATAYFGVEINKADALTVAESISVAHGLALAAIASSAVGITESTTLGVGTAIVSAAIEAEDAIALTDAATASIAESSVISAFDALSLADEATVLIEALVATAEVSVSDTLSLSDIAVVAHDGSQEIIVVDSLSITEEVATGEVNIASYDELTITELAVALFYLTPWYEAVSDELSIDDFVTVSSELNANVSDNLGVSEGNYQFVLSAFDVWVADGITVNEAITANASDLDVSRFDWVYVVDIPTLATDVQLYINTFDGLSLAELLTMWFVSHGTDYEINVSDAIAISERASIWGNFVAESSIRFDKTEQAWIVKVHGIDRMAIFNNGLVRALTAARFSCSGSGTGTYNELFGDRSGSALTTGSNNTLIGHMSGTSLTSGTLNTFVGALAGRINKDGIRSVAIGYHAGGGYGTSSNSDSVYVGASAGSYSYGTRNVCIGSNAGLLLRGGARNVLIGHESGSREQALDESLFIGHCAGKYETASSTLMVDVYDRGSEALSRAEALLHGSFNAVVASQSLTVNAGSLFVGGSTTGRVFWGPASRVLQWFDGTHFRIDSGYEQPTDVVIDCGTEKTLVLQEPVWDDVQFVVSQGKVPAVGAPNWEAFTTNTSEYAFDTGEYIDLGAQELPHWFKEGSFPRWHVHFAIKTANTSGASQWVKLQFYVCNQRSSTGTWFEYVAPVYSEMEIPNGAVALQYFYLDMGTDAQSGLKIGAQFKVRVGREAATYGTEYADSVFINQVGLHCQKDSLGSRGEREKVVTQRWVSVHDGMTLTESVVASVV